MDAQQARERATKQQFSRSLSEYTIIKDKIERAVEDGEMEIDIPHSIQDRTKQMLEDEGFSVVPQFNQHDGYTVTIKW